MEDYITKLYPDCNNDLNACFEKYVLDRIHHMKQFEIDRLKIGSFNRTFDEQFANITKQINTTTYSFWWSLEAKNIGTMKNNYVYNFELFLKRPRNHARRVTIMSPTLPPIAEDPCESGFGSF